jgi:hypothetical protein
MVNLTPAVFSSGATSPTTCPLEIYIRWKVKFMNRTLETAISGASGTGAGSFLEATDGSGDGLGHILHSLPGQAPTFNSMDGIITGLDNTNGSSFIAKSTGGAQSDFADYYEVIWQLLGTTINSPTIAVYSNSGTIAVDSASVSLVAGTSQMMRALWPNSGSAGTIASVGTTTSLSNVYIRDSGMWMSQNATAALQLPVDWVAYFDSAAATVTYNRLALNALLTSGPPGGALWCGPATIEHKHAQKWKEQREGDCDTYVKRAVVEELKEQRITLKMEEKLLDQDVELQMLRRAIAKQSERKEDPNATVATRWPPRQITGTTLTPAQSLKLAEDVDIEDLSEYLEARAEARFRMVEKDRPKVVLESKSAK